MSYLAFAMPDSLISIVIRTKSPQKTVEHAVLVLVDTLILMSGVLFVQNITTAVFAVVRSTTW